MAAALRQRYLSWRDRIAADAGFRRWATRFPLTRWIARRRARQLFDLVAGFTYSQVLLACVRLSLFEQLRDSPLPLARLAPRLGLAPARAGLLLDAACSLGLVERRDQACYGLGTLGAVLLDNPALCALVQHHAMVYRDLADPVALLRDQDRAELGSFWAYARQAPGATAPDAEAVAAYSGLMTLSQPLVADQILDAYPMGRHRILLDVGGGEGAFLRAALARNRHLDGWLFDLPPVAERARARMSAGPPGSALRIVGGDFLSDALPGGADLISLVRVLHDHDDAVVRTLLAATRRALAPGGALLLAEPLAGTAGAEPMGDAYFGLYFLAMGSGRPRRFEEYRAMLQDAGYTRVRRCATAVPLQVSVLIAT